MTKLKTPWLYDPKCGYQLYSRLTSPGMRYVSRTGKSKAKTAPLRRPRWVWKVMVVEGEGGDAKRYTWGQFTIV